METTIDAIVSMAVAKSTLKPGLRFYAEQTSMGVPTGLKVEAVILPELSARGKVQAELQCAEAGCTNTHVRERSDWHQCMKCPQHSKTKGKARNVLAITSQDPEIAALQAELKAMQEIVRGQKQAEAAKAALQAKVVAEREKLRKQLESAVAYSKANNIALTPALHAKAVDFGLIEAEAE